MQGGMRYTVALTIALCMAQVAWAVKPQEAGEVKQVGAESVGSEAIPNSLHDAEQSWGKAEKKAGKMLEAVDKLAAARRMVKTLRSKKKKVDEEFSKERVTYALHGADPADPAKDQPTPTSLEIAAAHKNVIDMRYSKAKAQEESFRRTAVEMGAITNSTEQNLDEEVEMVAKQAKDEASAAAQKKKEAIKEYQKSQKSANNTRALEKKLAATNKTAHQSLRNSSEISIDLQKSIKINRTVVSETKTVQHEMVEKEDGAQKASAEEDNVQEEIHVKGKAAKQAAIHKSKTQALQLEHGAKMRALKQQLELAKLKSRSETKRANVATVALKAIQGITSEEKALNSKLKNMKAPSTIN